MKRRITLELSKYKELDALSTEERGKAIGKLDEKHRKIYEEGYRKGKDGVVIYRDIPIESFKDKFLKDKSLVPFESIPWNLVAGKLKVRSYDDCRNMWFQNIYLTLSDSSRTHSKDNDIAFL